MPALIPWPFPLPEGFLDQLGYARTVEAFDSPQPARGRGWPEVHPDGTTRVATLATPVAPVA